MKNNKGFSRLLWAASVMVLVSISGCVSKERLAAINNIALLNKAPSCEHTELGEVSGKDGAIGMRAARSDDLGFRLKRRQTGSYSDAQQKMREQALDLGANAVYTTGSEISIGKDGTVWIYKGMAIRASAACIAQSVARDRNQK